MINATVSKSMSPLPKYKYSGRRAVKNGRTYYGKQNHKCKRCKRQFVAPKVEKKLELKETVKKLLLERISLRGIAG